MREIFKIKYGKQRANRLMVTIRWGRYNFKYMTHLGMH